MNHFKILLSVLNSQSHRYDIVFDVHSETALDADIGLCGVAAQACLALADLQADMHELVQVDLSVCSPSYDKLAVLRIVTDGQHAEVGPLALAPTYTHPHRQTALRIPLQRRDHDCFRLAARGLGLAPGSAAQA